ncbi:MAG: radical SAM protein [Candidatus Moranbacteria bacterium]|nr:radical SAM protein [Candidatus Moranbacteria bacterium]
MSNKNNNNNNNTCLFITGNCNSKCTYCYAPTFYITEKEKNAKFKKNIQNVDQAIKIGANSFVITGGEPLLYKDLFKLLAYIKANNCSVYLNTNAILFNNKTILKILKYVDILGLPLDSLDPKVNTKLGRQKSYQKVIDFLKEYEENQYYDQIKLKIATVATSINLKSIPELMEIIPAKADLWKIYQFCQRGRGEKNKNLLNINLKEFNQLKKTIKAKNPSIKIVFATEKSINFSNFLIIPSGKVLIPSPRGYQILGYLNDKLTQKKIQEVWNNPNYQANLRRTYLLKDS